MTYDKTDIQGFTMLGLIIGVLLTIGTIGIAWRIEKSEFQREAVSKNCAEWVVDEYGHTTFNFKDHTDKKEDLKHE